MRLFNSNGSHEYSLLEFLFYELNVFSNSRVIFHEFEFSGHGAPILRSYIEVSRAST
jgi:hypothetical protein